MEDDGVGRSDAVPGKGQRVARHTQARGFSVDPLTVNVALLEFRNVLVAYGTSSASASGYIGGYALLGLLVLGTWWLGRPRDATKLTSAEKADLVAFLRCL